MTYIKPTLLALNVWNEFKNILFKPKEKEKKTQLKHRIGTDNQQIIDNFTSKSRL